MTDLTAACRRATRSEEELHVGTRAPRARPGARLKTYVVTEEVTKTVPVQREAVRVEREPPAASAS
jgi:stress response protein YsnF